MSNEIANAFGDDMNLSSSFSPEALMKSAANLPTVADKPYLKLKDGDWVLGSDNEEVDDLALYAVNPNSFMFGYQEWQNNKAGGEILVPLGTDYNVNDLVLKFDPEEVDKNGVKTHRIADQVSIELYCATGDDKGLQMTFKTSTVGGVACLNKLAQKIARNAVENPDTKVPLVTLKSSYYVHKTYGRKNYVPELEIQYFDSYELDETNKKTAKKAPRKTTKKIAPRVEEEIEEEIEEVVEEVEAAPTGRRRRRPRG